MAIKAVIWDLGGVLVRTEDPAPRQALAARCGLQSRELEGLVFGSELGRRAQLGEITADQLWAFVLDRLGMPDENAGAFEAEFWGGDRLDLNLIDYIRKTKEQYTVALLSNAWDSLRKGLETRFAIHDVFDPVVISAEVGVMKPAPQIYQLALERCRVQPSEAVFLDDFIENVAGARAVGMHAIHFQDRSQALEDLESVLGKR